jgi:hypothetical protein
MRIAMNKKAICSKDQMASGTNVSKLCSRRALEIFGWSASYLQIKGVLPSFSILNLIITEERTRQMMKQEAK